MQLAISILFLLTKGEAGGQNRSTTTTTSAFTNPFAEMRIEHDEFLEEAKRFKPYVPPPYWFFMGYCRDMWQGDESADISPRVGYAEKQYDPEKAVWSWTWSVWGEKVDSVKYASGSLAVVVLNEGEKDTAPLAGVLVTEKDNPNKYSALIPGHYRWGEQVTEKTSVYLSSPYAPHTWCRVKAFGSRMTVNHRQKYTVIHTLESFIPNEPARPAALLLPNQRASQMIPSVKCTTFGFPEGKPDLRMVDAKVVQCGELEISNSNEVYPAEGSYFCAELAQDESEAYDQGVGWRWDNGVEWRVPNERRWPIFCQNWTEAQNSIDEGGELDETFLLAGFLYHLKAADGRAFAIAQYFY